jgi:hypothetical protein
MRRDLPKQLANVRHDVSDFLWHFTRRNNNSFATLKRIIEERTIRGSTDKYCDAIAVCFTEMPLTEAIRQSKVLDEFAYERFSDYGLGFRKEWIASKGGLPVVYQPDRLRFELAETSQWRHCEMDLQKGIDFSWQREWRVPTDKLVFSPVDDVVLVVRTAKEAFEIANENFEADFENEEVYWDHVWPYVTHEALGSATKPSDIDLLKVNPEERKGDSS